MTILIDTNRTLSLGRQGWENNPVILWENKATAANIYSDTGVAGDGAAANAVNGTTYDYALPLVSGVNTASLNIASVAEPFSIAAIAAHNLGTLGATVQIQYSTDGGTVWLDSGAGAVAPVDDQAIMWRFNERIAGNWRLIVSDIPAGQPAIGVYVIGREVILPQRIYQGYRPPITPTNVRMQGNISEGGHLLGSSVTGQGSTINATIANIPDTFIRSDPWTGFQSHFNGGRGFFWAWRPAKYGDVFYGWRSGGVIAPPNSGPKARMTVGFEARVYHDD